MNDADGTIIIKTEIDNSGFEKGLSKAEQDLKWWTKRKETLEKNNASSFAIDEANGAIERLTKEINQQEKAFETINDLTDDSSIGLTKMSDNFDKMSDSSENVQGNIAKTIADLGIGGVLIAGMALAGVGLSGAFKKVLEDEKELKAQIESIKNTLVEVFVPIVEKIVNFVKTLLYYIGYIVKVWTGVDIFANANKNLKDANKQAKELKKTSASFDKFNKLNSNKSTTTGASQKPTTLNGVGEIPEWVKWIADNKDKILEVLAGVALALTAIKFGLDGIKAFGLGLALYGILETIQSIINFLNDPTFSNFTDILKGISIAVIGIGIAFGSLPVIVAGAVGLIVALILEHYDDIIKIFDNLINWFDTDFTQALRDIFGPVGDIIALPFSTAIKTVKILFESFYGSIKKVVTGIIQIFKGDFKSGIENVFSGIKDKMLMPFKAVVNLINSIIKGINAISGGRIPLISWFDSDTQSGGGGGFRAKGGIYYPKLASGGIINQPGRGIAYHGATIAERGAEAVVPLTDTAQMELLGESIGRHVKFNADITLELESRVLARVMKEINNEDKFARNGV